MRRAATLTLFVLAGCASAEPRPVASASEERVQVVSQVGTASSIGTTAATRPRVVTLDLPIDNVWRALPVAYAALGIDIAHNDPTKRVIGNPGFRARRRLADVPISRLLDCGTTQGNPSADTYEVHFSVLTELQQDDRGRTVAVTTLDAVARPVNFPGDPVRCVSRGELETRIMNLARDAASR